MANSTQPRPLVVVTGISGYLGASVAHAFLRSSSYRVRGTVRKPSQAAAWRAHFPEYFRDEGGEGGEDGRLEVVLVEDMGVEGAFDEAVRGAEVVVHTASPFTFGKPWSRLLGPAVQGTLNVLRSAHRAGTVQHVVLTSSFAALQDYHADQAPGGNADKVYTEDDSCPLSWQEAKETDDQLLVYVASKKFAEKAAWDFVEQEKPAFVLTTILPTYIIGRSEQPIDSVDSLSTSAAWIREFIDKNKLPIAPIQSMIDVSDCALAHLRAVERRSVSANKRYFVAAHAFTGSEGAHALHEAFPDKRGRIVQPGGEKGWDRRPAWSWDSSRAVKELGLEWKPFAQTMREAAEQVFEFETRAS
ncbi:hypothetical protein Rhopal_002016-T1 [Rhodotorula paludigena]|uniref:Thioester reductase (TE) domain-containing protein n=1 Tax=Rhodotorula paludigena TaxID=86838 RepID=A0AAV5GI58_9BASI|nr:hypothetical protein Rhopal_002016-T1 [Rhodotorula paludigena]